MNNNTDWDSYDDDVMDNNTWTPDNIHGSSYSIDGHGCNSYNIDNIDNSCNMEDSSYTIVNTEVNSCDIVDEDNSACNIMNSDESSWNLVQMDNSCNIVDGNDNSCSVVNTNHDDWNNANMDLNLLKRYEESQCDLTSYQSVHLDQCQNAQLIQPGSYELSRWNSSSGSSYASSSPTSPDMYYYEISNSPIIDYYDMALNPPNLSTVPSYPEAGPDPVQGSHQQMPLLGTSQDQGVISHGPPAASLQPRGSHQGIPCPHCSAKPFKRRADLNRHISHRHARSSELPSFPCDYPRCTRRLDPFHRRDHFRDHLREFHQEDLEKRGVTESEQWYESRNTVKSWWRCGRCLRRVSVKQDGFECPKCRGVCCLRRQEARRR